MLSLLLALGGSAPELGAKLMLLLCSEIVLAGLFGLRYGTGCKIDSSSLACGIQYAAGFLRFLGGEPEYPENPE